MKTLGKIAQSDVYRALSLVLIVFFIITRFFGVNGFIFNSFLFLILANTFIVVFFIFKNGSREREDH